MAKKQTAKPTPTTKAVTVKVKHKSLLAKGDKPATKAEAAPKQDLIVVSPRAVQTGAGMQIIKLIQTEHQTSQQAKELGDKATSYRQEAIALATVAIWKAWKADDTINPANVYDSDGNRKKTLQQILVALELKNPDGSYTAKAAPLFPEAGMDRESTEGKRRQQFYNNFTMKLKQAMKAVVGAHEEGVTDMEFNADKHCLRLIDAPRRISGVKAKAATVDLDGTNVAGSEEKASIALLSTIGDERAGVAKPKGKGGVSDQAATAKAAASGEEAFGELCATLIEAINTIDGTWKADQKKYAVAVRDRLNEALASYTEAQAAA